MCNFCRVKPGVTLSLSLSLSLSIYIYIYIYMTVDKRKRKRKSLVVIYLFDNTKLFVGYVWYIECRLQLQWQSLLSGIKCVVME